MHLTFTGPRGGFVLAAGRQRVYGRIWGLLDAVDLAESCLVPDAVDGGEQP
jgi:hypothetical protein